MQIFGQPLLMSTALTTEQLTPAVTSSKGRSFASSTVSRALAYDSGSLPAGDIEALVVRLAGGVDRVPIADLEARAGSPRPAGALMVGAIGDRVLAATSISNGGSLSEPTPSGAAAAGAVGYAVASLRRRGTVRRTGTSS
jgi:hypothetical protein